ncbi:HORMA domain-containing protein 2 isoform X2 [Pelodiscus sinensis]|uniref:HORMA domain-containing protein 2 isoform X2 n=1 Tax=Pelodiscus sinensis TaxID=13735 RepID=UPI003F6B06BE
MATAQRSHTGKKQKPAKESLLFPPKIATEQQSLVLVKRLLAVSVSCITYLRGLFPESSYGTRYLDDLCLKILREDKSCLGSLQIVKWIQGCFDALEKSYLQMAVLAVSPTGKECKIYTNPKEPQRVTELYQFKFKYTKDGPQMDILSPQMRVSSDEVKKGSILLIRKLYLLLQHLGPLPNDVTLTMKLFYYNDVTPDDYQPPGFKEDSSPESLLFDGDPVNLKVGSIATGFHLLKVRVTTESKRMRELGNSLVQENGPTEISHQGLDCDEEEEGRTKNHAPPIRVDPSQNRKSETDSDPGCTYEASILHPPDTGKKDDTGVKGTDGLPSTKASEWEHRLDFAFSQEEMMEPRKKRKVSEPVQLLPAGRN